MALYLAVSVLDKISLKKLKHSMSANEDGVSSKEKRMSSLPLLGDLSWVMSFLVLENGCSRMAKTFGKRKKL